MGIKVVQNLGRNSSVSRRFYIIVEYVAEKESKIGKDLILVPFPRPIPDPRPTGIIAW